MACSSRDFRDSQAYDRCFHALILGLNQSRTELIDIPCSCLLTNTRSVGRYHKSRYHASVQGTGHKVQAVSGLPLTPYRFSNQRQSTFPDLHPCKQNREQQIHRHHSLQTFENPLSAGHASLTCSEYLDRFYS